MLVPPQTVFPGTPSSNNLGSYQQSGSKHATYNEEQQHAQSATHCCPLILSFQQARTYGEIGAVNGATTTNTLDER
ncbi:bcl-6 corepressor [Lasius niger]|uniref:Bcl-6 corepressor n=1 Tax=Lasius niger TaxID=67767 RepID=A0A0J7L329_LASNI|nr:bcl-6 corepressor [Lasius niger]